MESEYKFDDFDWLADMSGFNKPTDVYYGSILLGVITSLSVGYIIDRVLTPKGSMTVMKTKNNNFKTKIDAAKVLHNLWKLQRAHN